MHSLGGGKQNGEGMNGTQQQGNWLLSQLSAFELSLLEPILDLDLVAGESLFRSGQVISQVVFPHTGSVSITVPVERGISIEAALIGRDGIIGSAAGAGLYVAVNNAVVQIAGKASAVGAAQFHRAVSHSPRLRELAARCDSVASAQAQQSAACNAVHSVEARICRWLLELHDRSDERGVALTQDFLARMLGVRRTTVTLISRKLQSSKALQWRRGRVLVLDRDVLEHAACGCYAQSRRWAEQLLPERSSLDMTSIPLPDQQSERSAGRSLLA
jgi:CRP-like cAMP-binding protein